MTGPTIEQIRKAICKNRGGFEKAKDAEIKTIWNSLGPKVKAAYLESVKDDDSNIPPTEN